MGKTSGDGEFVRRTEDLRVAQVDHVFPQGLLLLRAAQEEGFGSVLFSGPDTEESLRSQVAPGIKTQGGSSGSHLASRSSGAASDRLAERSLRDLGDPEFDVRRKTAT